MIVDDIVAYLKNPSVYSLEKEGPLNHFVNYCSEVELGFYSDGAYSILVSRSKQQPEGMILTVSDADAINIVHISVSPALIKFPMIFLLAFIRTLMMRVLQKSR
ncbi:hypothetical protein LB437_16005 [Escherichia coli]